MPQHGKKGRSNSAIGQKDKTNADEEASFDADVSSDLTLVPEIGRSSNLTIGSCRKSIRVIICSVTNPSYRT